MNDNQRKLMVIRKFEFVIHYNIILKTDGVRYK